MLASLRALQFLIYWRVVDFLSCRSRTDSIRRGPPMQQIADWLKKLGLPEYGERFAENGIDVSVLPHLTDQDLKDMGVLLGHRRKMLAAIGELSSKSPPRPQADRLRSAALRHVRTTSFPQRFGSITRHLFAQLLEWHFL